MAKKTKKELKRRIKELEAKVSCQSDEIACLELHYFPPLNTKQILNPDPSYGPWPSADNKKQVLYTFGESSIEVNGVTVDEMPQTGPFARVPGRGKKNG